MPVYDFKNKATGDVKEFILPAGVTVHQDPDGNFWEKVTTPPRIAIGGYKEPPQAQEVRRGYYKVEQQGWNSKFTKNQVKKAWGL